MFALANIANEHRLEDQATSPSAILPHMLMVIFGAGASFDSSSTYTIGTAPPGASQTDRDNDYYRLPLAKDLFANRPSFIEAINAFPQCKTIVPRLRDPAVTSGIASIGVLSVPRTTRFSIPAMRTMLGVGSTRSV